MLWALRERAQDLRRDIRFRHFVMFKNHGAAAGAALAHSHTQLLALPVVPREVQDEVEGARAHYAAEGALPVLRHHPAGGGGRAAA